MKTSTAVALVIAVAVLVAGGMWALELRSSKQDPLGELNRWTGGTTNTGFSCTGTSQVMVASSSARQYLAIVNAASSSKIFLGLGENAVLNEGIMLAAGGSFEINLDNLFTGAIHCISDAGPATSTVVQK